MDANKGGIPMDEAPKDPGVLTTHPSYTDTDFEGKLQFKSDYSHSS